MRKFLTALGSKPPGTVFHIITANLPDELSELKYTTLSFSQLFEREPTQD